MVNRRAVQVEGETWSMDKVTVLEAKLVKERLPLQVSHTEPGSHNIATTTS